MATANNSMGFDPSAIQSCVLCFTLLHSLLMLYALQLYLNTDSGAILVKYRVYDLCFTLLVDLHTMFLFEASQLFLQTIPLFA